MISFIIDHGFFANMCLAVPGKILELNGSKAIVDYGGVRREVDISLVEAGIGDYVIVHAGFAIQIMDKKAAEESLELWQKMFESGR